MIPYEVVKFLFVLCFHASLAKVMYKILASYILDLQASFKRHRTRDPGHRTQDRGPRTEDPGQGTQDRGSITEDPG